MTPCTNTEHRPGLRTDHCRLCARNQRRGLTLCHGCPESARRVHLVVHVCLPAAVPVGQLLLPTSDPVRSLAGHLATCTTCELDEAGDVERACAEGAGLVGEGA